MGKSGDDVWSWQEASRLRVRETVAGIVDGGSRREGAKGA